MMIKQKINDEVVKPIKLKKIDMSKIKGHRLLPELYCNVYICAKKKSGKTNVINKIIEACGGEDTEYVFFATTINKDQNLRKIVKRLRKNGNTVVTHMALKEEKEDILKNMLTDLGEDKSDSDSDSEVEKKKKKKVVKYISVDGYSDDEDRKKKSRKLCPEYIFVFDDLGNLLKNSAVDRLMKTNRHYKSKVIVSSQYPNDLHPESIKQMNYIILFKGHRRDKLEKFYEEADLSIDFDTFYSLYKDATEKPYSFLYIDVNNQQFRENFNYIYVLSKGSDE